MAKHSKGKHSQPKAAFIFENRAAKAVSSDAASILENEADRVASSDVNAQPSETPMPQPSPDPSGAPIVIEKKPRDWKKTWKRIGIGAAITVGVLGAIYLGGSALFATHFLPNTTVGGIDISLKTPEDVQQEFDGRVDDYTFHVKGHRLNIEITSDEAGFDIDSVAMTDAIREGQNPWTWPVDIFFTRDVSQQLTDALTATKLSDVVKAAVDEVNADAVDPIDAFIEFDASKERFSIVPEVPGTRLDFESVLEEIIVGAMNLEPQIVILDSGLVKPTVYRDDQRLNNALALSNSLINADITLMLDGKPGGHVGPTEISSWVRISPEFATTLDEAAMNESINELASKFNTVGAARSYVRPDGKNITVKGGDYGWKVDNAALASQIKDAVVAGGTTNIDVPVLQRGTGWDSVGGKDWGDRYIDVDISEQHARFYDGGNIIWESAIVTGLPTKGRATPQGVFDINSKGKNITLVGSDTDGDGKPDYETPVTYWMPFKGNSVGFHDATWQPWFGGSRYRSNGSHGCVNLPYSKAESLYSLIKTGDVVVVHT